MSRLAGYLIVLADGVVDDSEIQSLGRIVSPDIFQACIATINQYDVDSMRNEVIALAENLNNFLSPMQKLNLIRDLSVISYADGEIAEPELHVLYNLCQLFHIHPEFVDQVLHNALAEVD